jgi:hypothetical protein
MASYIVMMCLNHLTVLEYALLAPDFFALGLNHIEDNTC